MPNCYPNTCCVRTVAGKNGDVILYPIDVHLGNVDNTSDIDKPISSYTQIALNLKQDKLVAGDNITIVGNVISATYTALPDTDNYVDSVAFDDGTRTLTLGRTGVLSDLTVVIPGGSAAEIQGWQDTLIINPDLTQDNTSLLNGFFFDMVSTNVATGDNGEFYIDPTTSALYSYNTTNNTKGAVDVTVDNVLLSGGDSATPSLLQVAGAGVSFTNVATFKWNGAVTAPGYVLTDVLGDGNLTLQPSSGGGGGGSTVRWGIEDNLGIQNRAIDMQNFGLTHTNGNHYEFYTGDSVNYLLPETEFLIQTAGISAYAQNNDTDYGNFGISPFSFQANVGTTDNANSLIALQSGYLFINSQGTSAAATVSQLNMNPTQLFIQSGHGDTGIYTGFRVQSDSSYIFYQDPAYTAFNIQFPNRAYNGTLYSVLSVNGNVADSTGNVTISTGGGGTTYTVDNGLTENVAGNFQLGGTLLQNTIIQQGTNLMIFNGTDGTERGKITNVAGQISLEVDREDFTKRSDMYITTATIQIVQLDDNTSTNGRRITFQSATGIKIGEYVSGIYKGITVKPNTGNLKFDNYGLGVVTGTATYALQVDASGNVIEGALGGGGGGSYTSNNAVTLSGSNFQLGGTLLHNTSIIDNGFSLTVTNGTTATSLFAVNTSTGEAFQADSFFGQAIVATSGGSGRAIDATSEDGVAGEFRTNPSVNRTTPVSILQLISIGGGGTAAQNGFGTAIDFYSTTSTNTNRQQGSILTKWTDVTDASPTARYEYWGVQNGNFARKLAIEGSGDVIVDSGDVEVATIAKGLILKAPDGTRWRVVVTNGGILNVVSIP